MAMNNDDVPRETPPLSDLGPILTLDPAILEDRLKRMNEKDRKRLLMMLESNVVE